jgi:hypothetical protein
MLRLGVRDGNRSDSYEGRGQGCRRRRPRPWCYHAIRYRIVAETRRTRRARRGHPAKIDPPPTESGYRLEENNGWTVLATTVHVEVGTNTEIPHAYQEQLTTVEPGFHWIKNPAAISPVWLEKPERIAALAMLTVVGFWSTVLSRDRSASICALMTNRYLGTMVWNVLSAQKR